ncbi:MAG: type II toxin-antitoxin system HipA family toxin, partial [Rubrivivax sp.]
SGGALANHHLSTQHGQYLQQLLHTHRFVYEESWLASARVRPLSLSLPITPDRTVTGPVVANFFDNLLPDDARIRRRVSARFRVDSTEVFDLLQAIGRDCVGAVQLLPPGLLPTGFDRVECEPMSDDAVARHLRGVTAEPGLGADQGPDDLRISIAGAQEKTALLRVDGQWCRPLGATPTTHILKLPLGLVGGRRLDLTHSVYNEWLCAQLLRELGLPVASAEIATFGEEMVLAVERFDRQWVGEPGAETRWIARIPQEDFCQVLGRASHEKYDSQGGPGMAQCLQVLRASRTASADIRHFLCAQLAFWLLAATDGHAKNFSIFLLPGGGYRMTPLYDVISAWPVIGHGPNRVAWQEAKLAMAVRSKNVHDQLERIQTRHWHGLAQRSGAERVWEAMQALVDRVEPAIAEVQRLLPAGFPERTAGAIFDGLRRQQGRWQAGLQSLAGPASGG